MTIVALKAIVRADHILVCADEAGGLWEQREGGWMKIQDAVDPAGQALTVHGITRRGSQLLALDSQGNVRELASTGADRPAWRIYLAAPDIPAAPEPEQ